ncbi:MAG: winged helix-turn-helix domain-containing protein [Deltaproteobacteria bacterium]|nr:winged helix-turn-helix domain-containing protein [Deltaproteobacteria bacterium]
MQAEQRKEALKRLKQERKEAIKANSAVAKQQKKDLGLIKERLAQGPATALEVAQDLGMPPKQVMWYLAAMRKYGMAGEGAKSGDYFTYELITPEPAAC